MHVPTNSRVIGLRPVYNHFHKHHPINHLLRFYYEMRELRFSNICLSSIYESDEQSRRPEKKPEKKAAV
ncbi:hypothetical protein L484_025480 [Morus notabilis]|uniref:Uncharacterized protein n=1 Tax=Morus notabilis TaxID=981085 RepID=W9RNN1_9ROSA|nr:hypothetical protein L484_025480 [Morus notabilis]